MKTITPLWFLLVSVRFVLVSSVQAQTFSTLTLDSASNVGQYSEPVPGSVIKAGCA